MSDDAERECPDDENLLYSKFSIQEFILGIRDGSMKQWGVLWPKLGRH